MSDLPAPFANRADAGRRLAKRVVDLHPADPVVVGLPRGGVPVAAEVAAVLQCPLDVIVVRKLGVPGHEELGFAAIAEDGVTVVNDAVVVGEGVSRADETAEERRQRDTLDRRVTSIRAHHVAVPLAGKSVIVVDDGIATGIDARAACRVARLRGASQVVLAVPVAPAGWQDELGGEADVFVAVHEPATFGGVGQFYEDFTQVTDEEVLALLAGASSPAGAGIVDA